MNLESPCIDVWLHARLDAGSQTMSSGILSLSISGYGFFSGRLSLLMTRGPWTMPGMYPTSLEGVTFSIVPVEKVWGLELLSWSGSHESIWDPVDQTKDLCKHMKLKGRVNTAQATWTENGGERTLRSYIKVLLSEEGGTGEAKSEGFTSGVDKSDQRFSTLFFDLWTSSQENCAKLPLQGFTLWKLLEVIFWFYFVISNHTDNFTCFSNIVPSPRTVIPRMGSGKVLPVREKGFWSHSDLSLNPSCTNIYLPCSISFCGMWDYQYLSLRGWWASN